MMLLAVRGSRPVHTHPFQTLSFEELLWVPWYTAYPTSTVRFDATLRHEQLEAVFPPASTSWTSPTATNAAISALIQAMIPLYLRRRLSR